MDEKTDYGSGSRDKYKSFYLISLNKSHGTAPRIAF